jgi:hypothetical protein
MAVYVDDLFTSPRLAQRGQSAMLQWCHMWADTDEELHHMARTIGLRRAWFQRHRVQDHYDLTPRKREAAIRHGATPANLRKWLAKPEGPT